MCISNVLHVIWIFLMCHWIRLNPFMRGELQALTASRSATFSFDMLCGTCSEFSFSPSGIFIKNFSIWMMDFMIIMMTASPMPLLLRHVAHARKHFLTDFIATDIIVYSCQERPPKGVLFSCCRSSASHKVAIFIDFMQRCTISHYEWNLSVHPWLLWLL